MLELSNCHVFLSLKISFKIISSVDPEIPHLDIQCVNVTVEGFPIT